jgi:hypothetical protein
VPLTAKELAAVWTDLAEVDARRGQKAIRTALGVPEQALALLLKELKPARVPDAKSLTRILQDLESESFKAREEATRELEKMGDAAAPMVRSALGDNGTLELKRRLEGLLETYAGAQRRRTLRAVQALEHLGTPAARELLARLAEGAPEALLTREAKAAAQRLTKLPMATAN